METLKIPLVYSEGKGIPCIWESGGATKSDNAEVVLVAGPDGLPKPALTTHDKYNGNHALIPVKIGDHVIRLSRAKEHFFIMAGKIVALTTEKPAVAICGVLMTFDSDSAKEGINALPSCLLEMLGAATEKSYIVLCDHPVFTTSAKDYQFISTKYERLASPFAEG